MAQRNTEPLVSVIVPTFNRWPMLQIAIESVLFQSYKNIELIIIDDGSTDQTSKNIKRLYPTVKYVYQNHSGVSVARNHGISLAKGHIIAFLDSDDYWHRDKLEKQLETLNSSGASLVGCYANLVNYNGAPLGLWAEKFSANELRVRNRLPGGVSGAVIKRDAISGDEWFEETLRFGEDWKLWLRILNNSGKILIVPQPLVTIRIHNIKEGDQVLQDFYSDIRSIIDWMEYKEWTEKRKALAYLHLDCARICAKNKRMAIRHLIRSFYSYPLKMFQDDNRLYLLAEIIGLRYLITRKRKSR